MHIRELVDLVHVLRVDAIDVLVGGKEVFKRAHVKQHIDQRIALVLQIVEGFHGVAALLLLAGERGGELVDSGSGVFDLPLDRFEVGDGFIVIEGGLLDLLLQLVGLGVDFGGFGFGWEGGGKRER